MMHIRETNQPCLVAKCQRCGTETWPPYTTKDAAERNAREDWGFQVMHFDSQHQRIEPLTLCAACFEAELPA